MHHTPSPKPQPRAKLAIAAAAMAVLSAALTACGGDSGSSTPTPTATPLANQLYTQSNETANAVIHFARQADGTIVRKESTLTTGAGTNAVGVSGATGPDSLAGQHSITISSDGTTVFVVNGGDDTISTLAVDQTSGALTLMKKNATAAGHIPNSLAFSGGVLYATFIAGTNQLAAYKVGTDGTLTSIGSYSLTALGGLTTAAPTQVLAAPDGKSVVVNAGTGSNAIMSFPVNADGTLGAPTTNSTQITTPFAGAFLPGATYETYLATNIGAVSLTEFSVNATGALTALGSATATGVPGVGAPCWMSVTPTGGVAFVGNGSGSITAYSASTTTGVTLLNATAAEEPAAKTGVPAVAADSWISPDGKFLYVAYLGDDKVVAYAIGLNGSLAKLGETVIGTATGLSLQGMVGI